MIRSIIIFIIIALLAALPVATVYAAPPPDGPPGLERAIQVKEQHEKALLGISGVVGVGIGLNGNGRPAVLVLTETPGERGLPAFIDGIPVIAQVSGKFVALPKPNSPPKEPATTDWWTRPVPIGVSTGHPAITAGTIGARVKDSLGNVYALSNNHVYADENNASLGDSALQPGCYDGGVDTQYYRIGTLAGFKPLDFSGGDNTIDAAIALSSPEKLAKSTPRAGYGTPKSTTASAYIGMKVKKFGRTTGLTKGQVYAINVSVNVQYTTGVAYFTNQILITPGAFSAGGDSGSLIVTDAKRGGIDRQPVGLLFAGSNLFTIANPIDPVLSYFGVTIDGE